MNILRQSPEGGGSGGEASEKPENLIRMSQEQFDEVIASRLSRQEKKIKEEHQAELNKLKDEIESLSDKNLPGDLKQREEKLKTEYQLVIEKQSEETNKVKSELERLREVSRVSVMQNEVVTALSQANVIVPNDVWLILHSNKLVGLDGEGTVVPVNPNTGEPLLSEGGKPMDLKTFIEGYLSERPHYVNPSGNRGSGGTGGRATPADGGVTPTDVRGVFQSGEFQKMEADMRSKGRLWHGGIIPDWDK